MASSKSEMSTSMVRGALGSALRCRPKLLLDAGQHLLLQLGRLQGRLQRHGRVEEGGIVGVADGRGFVDG